MQVESVTFFPPPPPPFLELKDLYFTCALRKFQRFHIYPIFNEFSQGGKTWLAYQIPQIPWSNGCWTLLIFVKFFPSFLNAGITQWLKMSYNRKC